MNELFSFDDAHAVIAPASSARVAVAVAALAAIADHGTYDDPRTFLNLPEDAGLGARVGDVVRALKTEELKHIFLIGIGGSSLGMRALAPVTPRNGVRLHVLETVSAHEIAVLGQYLNEVSSLKEIAVVIVSKSGTTTETIANAGYCIDALEKKLGSISARIAVVTDEGSPLAVYGAAHGYRVVEIPHAIGGRYSVFSAAGLLPFGLVGGALEDLLSGVRAARTAFLNEGVESVAARLGAYLVAYAEGGYRIHNMFVFEPLLEDLGKWWRQLVGESLGKNTLRIGESAQVSVLPIVSVGSTDLHSVGQLYLSDAPGIATTFLSVDGVGERVPEGGIASALVPGLGGVSYGAILQAIMQGTTRAYETHHLPYLALHMKEFSPAALGAFMQTQMIAVAIAGEMLDIDAFDQPNVEDYKRITREILGHGG